MPLICRPFLYETIRKRLCSFAGQLGKHLKWVLTEKGTNRSNDMLGIFQHTHWSLICREVEGGLTKRIMLFLNKLLGKERIWVRSEPCVQLCTCGKVWNNCNKWAEQCKIEVFYTFYTVFSLFTAMCSMKVPPRRQEWKLFERTTTRIAFFCWRIALIICLWGKSLVWQLDLEQWCSELSPLCICIMIITLIMQQWDDNDDSMS